MTPDVPYPTIGEVLQKEFMEPHNLSIFALSDLLNVDIFMIEDLIYEDIFPDHLIIRLSKLFGTTTDFWLDLYINRRKRSLKDFERCHGGTYAHMIEPLTIDES